MYSDKMPANDFEEEDAAHLQFPKVRPFNFIKNFLWKWEIFSSRL